MGKITKNAIQTEWQKRRNAQKKNEFCLHNPFFLVIISSVNLLTAEKRYRMKRVKAACITQTLHFLLKEEVGHDYALKLVSEEIKKYKEQLDRNKTQYKILSEEVQEDGSVIIEIKKQYNTSPVGQYLD